ncbi:MAG: membrane protein insertase YidC [Kiritimatiellae bacterium]|nr:membrane protein insertase YidC [Kiritimatiellia bacterium]
MGIFSFITDPIAMLFGWVLRWIFELVPNYLIAIFLFVLLTRILMFPLSLKTQKGQADRARLAPRLERLKKKYAKDPKKFQEKQMALYEKHGVSPTGGCLPMIFQMLILFGIITVIGSPLSHLKAIPKTVINASATAIQTSLGEEVKAKEAQAEAAKKAGDTTKEKKLKAEIKEADDLIKTKLADKYYYRELITMQNLEKHKEAIVKGIAATKDESGKEYGVDWAKKRYNEMITFEKDFDFFGDNMLRNPGEGGFAGINILWLIPFISGVTALLSGMLSMHYTKQSGGDAQQAQGCSNVMMFVMMPAMSLFIAFSVPGAVGIYWVYSNIIAIAQTYILNQIYNPVKIRAQAEIEYAEHRKKKAEDKKRLAEARAREQRELALQMNEEKKDGKKGKGKPKAKPQEEKEPTEEPTEETTTETGESEDNGENAD